MCEMKIVTRIIKVKDIIYYEPSDGIDGYFNYKTKCILRNTINVKNVTFHSRLFGIVAKN
jgi:hypothetical protein